MKRTLIIVLVFAAVLAALLGVSALAEKLRPAEEVPAEETHAPADVANAMTPDKATQIIFREDGASCLGMGAEASGGVVTIAYPGTYRVSGSRMDGRLVVDLGDYHGGVYLILDGLELSSMDGPALHVKQADKTVIHLTEGTKNNLRDGENYTIQEGTLTRSGAGIYSADDLEIQGGGVLTVTGNAADGIRSKDSLVIRDGIISVYSTDDGLQASDYMEISGGSVIVATYGDGISVKEGYVTVNGGALDITCGGDGIQALTDLRVEDGSVKVLAHGGADYYDAVALGDISAKGLKGEYITITGGSLDLDTADDGIHAARDLSITGGTLRVSSGDDAVCAAAALDISGVTVDVPRSYEGLEADTVTLKDVTLTAAAENNGIDGGDGGVTTVDSAMTLTAPRGVSAGGTFAMRGGRLLLNADGTDSLFSFQSADIAGGEILAYAATGRSAVLLEKGSFDDSLLYVWNEPVPAGTRFQLANPSGTPVLTFYRNDSDSGALLIVSGALMDGQTYALTVGDGEPVELTAGEGCAVYEEELPAPQRGGFGGPRR